MGLITRAMGLVFGGGRNVIADTAAVFRENAEAAAGRSLTLQTAAMEQFSREFATPRRGLFDRLMDGVNRLPRPAMALGTLGLLVAAMVDPIWFASRMEGIALVPEPMWWLLGAIVSFYFGARHQAKGQEFRRSIIDSVAQASAVTGNIRALEALAEEAASGPAPLQSTEPAETAPDAARPEPRAEAETENAALTEWRAGRG